MYSTIRIRCVLVTWILVGFSAADSSCAGDKCTADGLPGECIRLNNCQPLQDEIQAAGTPMPKHLRNKLHKLSCGFESSQPIVCCVANPNRIQSTSPPEEEHDNNGNSNSIDGSPVDVSDHRNLELLPSECGFLESDRVFGGNRTRLYEMPWMVLIVYDSPRGTKLSCGGTLINERYVMTAAHCVSFLGKGLTLQAVRLGEHDTRQDPDCERLEGELMCAPAIWNVSIEEVIAHSGYSRQSLYDDIALLRLSRPADFGLDSMNPICLPATSELQNENLTGKDGLVAGWGATEDGLQSPVLLKVDLPIISNDDCQVVYKGNPRISSRQLCAGGVEDQDACGGDSGGPLMYPGPTIAGSRMVQRGIVSYGSKRCGIGGFPGVYTNVAYYMDWILDHIKR